MMMRPGTVGRLGRLGLVAAAVRGAFAPFSPASLFANGEQGLWYDVGDFDRYMSELGPELVTNGDFSNGTVGWSGSGGGSLSVVDGELQVSSAAGSFGRASTSVAIVVGKTYLLTVEARRGTATDGAQIVGASGGIPSSGVIASQSKTIFRSVFVATASFGELRLVASAGALGGSAFYDNISVRELTAINTATLFQDAAGTIPVTAVEQPVGRILDKSGRGNHASQATTTARGVLRQNAQGAYYIDIDGTDDSYATGNINFTATDKVTIWAGLRKVDDTLRMFCELSANLSNNQGAFYVVTGLDVSSLYSSQARGSSTPSVGTITRFNPGLYPAPDSAVITAQHDIAGDLSRIRRNGSSTGAIDGTGDKGTGNSGNYPLYLFSRGGSSARWKGQFYGLIIRGAATDTTQLEQTEQWLNSKMGGIY